MAGMNRRAPKRDNAEEAIVEALRFVGCSVQTISERDFPDVIVGVGGMNYLIEVKTRGGKLRERQSDFAAAWKGQTGVARTPQQALALIGYGPGDIEAVMSLIADAHAIEATNKIIREARKAARLAKKR
jgi:hypothetical protein